MIHAICTGGRIIFFQIKFIIKWIKVDLSYKKIFQETEIMFKTLIGLPHLQLQHLRIISYILTKKENS